MGRETKKEAQAKLAKFTPKIGYPVKWRDYASSTIAPDDLVGNCDARAARSSIDRNLAKLGKPVDRDEWGMTPQTVNAYYNPEMNEIVFPAAILQPPFFDAEADDAVNYGGIGAVIGHEISHGFDDQGSQYDGDGNLRDWWTQDDLKRFKAKTQALVAQYDALRAGAGLPRQRRADARREHRRPFGPRDRLQGLPAVARRQAGAGHRRPDRRAALLLRLGAGVARQIARAGDDPPDQSRPACAATGARSGPLRNQPGFYEAFGVKEGDRMYLPPDQRVTLW